MQIEFTVYGDPKGQPRPKAFARGGRAAVYDPGTAEGWKSLIAIACKEYLETTEPLEGPLQLDIDYYFKRPKAHFRANGDLKDSAPCWYSRKPDRDNLDKAVMDALTQLGIWKDDKQVVAGHTTKQYTNGKARADIQITQLCDHSDSAIDAPSLEFMQTRGGSFATNIAKAFCCADRKNSQKLLTAFRPLFEKYRLFAQMSNKLGKHYEQ